jgi:hypothetical protein
MFRLLGVYAKGRRRRMGKHAKTLRLLDVASEVLAAALNGAGS